MSSPIGKMWPKDAKELHGYVVNEWVNRRERRPEQVAKVLRQIADDLLWPHNQPKRK